MRRNNWQIPSFKIHEFSHKKTEYCLCIPIINEGQRLKQELKKMEKNKIYKIVDIIICDGGSSDG